MGKPNSRWSGVYGVCAGLVVLCCVLAPRAGRAQEVILQYFETTWPEIARRMPELAEAGYSALWLPPPFKAGNQFSVGFDTFDRFDIGSKDQMGGVRTKYGVEADLIHLMETAHRFGIRVYFDNVMAHNGGPIPGYDENTSIYAQPGFVPEDFHLRRLDNGFYRKMPDYPNWSDEWQVLHRNPFGLDTALESPVNASFGAHEGATFPKWVGVRHPDNPEYYLDTDLPVATNAWNQPVFTFANKEPFADGGWTTNGGVTVTGAGNRRFDWHDANANGQHDPGEASEAFEDTGIDPTRPERQTLQWGFGDGKYNMGNPAPEDVNAMMFRMVRWFVDKVKADGFRLDAVKHVPFYFFGQTFGDKDPSNWGYNGQIQEQFNITRGFGDWGNHRNSVFDTDIGRDDAMLFGEHLGAPPGDGDYIASGMRIGNNDLYNDLANNAAGWGNLTWHDQPGHKTPGVGQSVMYAGSHDFNYISGYDRPTAHALILTRAGLPIIYTDGYNETPFFNGSKYFPQHGDNAFLGQYNDKHLLNLLYINQLFARGEQLPKWGDSSYVAYERRDFRETGHPGNAVILAFMAARNGAGGQARSWGTTFPEGARLRNYSIHGGGFYVNVWGGQIKNDSDQNPVVPGGGYFAFSWRVPEMPAVWDDGLAAAVKPITILQDGEPAPSMIHTRRDGFAGDPNFNPYGVAGDTAGDYQYGLPIPRVTKGSNLTILARADGSAVDIRMKLDGGVDLNSQMGLGPQTGGRRDYGPGSWDFLLGTEAMQLRHRVAEKFAAKDAARNRIGSPGAETFICTIGTPGFTINTNTGGVNFDGGRSVSWVYHDPAADNQISSDLQFLPAPADAAGQPISIWAKVGYAPNAHAAWLYYTTNGIDFPEGSAGVGKGQTRVAPLVYMANGGIDGVSTSQWWLASLPPMPASTVLRYKIGVARLNAPDLFPFNGTDHAHVKPMETLFAITGFNGHAVGYYPHNDYGTYRTGLVEGFHVLRSKAFLNRGGAASVFNQFVQTFYYDTRPPDGAIMFPAADGQDLFGSTYGVVVRGDRTVEEVWYRITDVDPENDDASTGTPNGNGAWVRANEITPNHLLQSPFPREWRFDYVNIAPSNTATIQVRLREATSSTNMALNDVDGHFTTLTRVVNARGPLFRLFVLWPQADGDVVSEGYVLKAAFTETLANGISSNDLRNCFTLSINTNVQPKSAYGIQYGEQPGYHALTFALPNLYNNSPDEEHLIEITFNRAGYPPLRATRLVRPLPVNKPYVTFVSPPSADANGQPYTIVLHDVAAPTVSQRQFRVQVDTATNALDVAVRLTQGAGTFTPEAGNPAETNNLLSWYFTWQFPLTNDPAVLQGTYRLQADVDTDGDTNTAEATAVREARVVLREMVAPDALDIDDDDDGLSDFDEQVSRALPSGAFTTWQNGDVHAWFAFGRTDGLSPDSDGDGLPDGLELGWRQPGTNTSILADTDGDGYPNFLADLDPPFYNTCDNIGLVPNVSECNSGSKTDLRGGSTTDPNNPDSDFDGIPDGVEDANRNGWVDGDGAPIQPDWIPWLGRDWPDRSLDISDTWLETDPNNSDTDKDGLSDGYGEDQNFNGRIDGDTNTNRLYDAGEAWTETNPLSKDSDGDGLPDGWEVWHGLDPLDDGIDSLRTADVDDGNPDNGPDGDPDGDGLSNLTELVSGKHPMIPDVGAPPPVGDIIIGTGSFVQVGAVANHNDFTDWTHEHVIALDPYDALDGAFNGGDVYFRPWASDGLERSRDLVAFYAHDGGALTNGGDDTFYFRVDLNDLQANAEDSGLDIYVVIDTGNPAVGERKVLDEVDVLTDMRWEAIVFVDNWTDNKVYVNKPGSWDTDTLEDMMVFGVNNVDVRDMAHPYGFKKVHFNSNMDAVEFSISRKALLDAGWAGDFASLNFQVFTTRDNIGNNPRGSGDLDGPDIADIIRSDWFAEDFAGINEGNVDDLRYKGRINLKALPQWVGVNAANDRGKRIKVIPLVHSAQAIQPGHVMHDLVNNGAGAGYYRPFDVHQAYGAPLTLHVTPTLASGLQWARVDTNQGPAFKDGPALNARIAALASNGVVQLLGSTFADHLMPYFTPDYTADNVALAHEVLSGIYGQGVVSTQSFWTPERLLDADVLDKVKALGFQATFLDQSQHLRRWFSLAASQGEDAYRINRIRGVDCFVINDRFNAYRFSSTDNGPSIALREILNRRARSGWWGNQHPQVLTLFYNWEEFGDKTKADGYDRIVGWMASRGWIELVTPDQVLRQQVDISLPPDGVGDAWNRVDRGYPASLVKTAHDWIQYGAQDNLDNWYLGSAHNQGLMTNRFALRPGTNMPTAYGMLYFGGVVSQAWDAVRGLAEPDSGLGRLARGTLHASTFLSAFHKQTQNPLNMTKFSTGDWAYPDGSFDVLDDFARIAQSQTRMASVLVRVAQWAQNPPAVATTAVEDVDLDGEGEYLLFNRRVFGVFERIGGRLIGVWVRNLQNGDVFQAAGNLVSYAGSATEEQGNFRVDPQGKPGAYRMSLLTDWWATKGGGTAMYVNDLYAFSDRTNGWRAVSSDGQVTKTIRLSDAGADFAVEYALSGAMSGQTLYTRHGLGPNLDDLIVAGQRHLKPEQHGGGVMWLANETTVDTVRAVVRYGAPYNAAFNTNAVDDEPGAGFNFASLRMRNLAQTHQVEMAGSNTFTFALGFQAVHTDSDGDGIPNIVEETYPFLAPDNAADGAEDEDGDGYSNRDEYIAGTDPGDAGSTPRVGAMQAATAGAGVKVRFPTEPGRSHYIWYSNQDPAHAAWVLATTNPIPGTGGIVEWTDDGTHTAPAPTAATNRLYRIGIGLDE